MDAQSIDPVIGTTTDSYVVVIDIDVRRFSSTIITISNEHVTNKIEYYVDVRQDYDDGTGVKVWNNVLDGTYHDELILVRHARVLVWVKSVNLSFHAPYKIDIIAGR
jgi:hypothetical protein